MSGDLVFPSLSEFSTVYCDPHSQRFWHSLFTSEQSMCCSGVFWGELLCSPSAAQITWWVPVLRQGAEIRELANAGPGTGLPACTPCSFGPFPRAHLLCLSQVGIRLSCYPFHHSQRGPEPSSLLPPHTIPLGRLSAPAPSIQYRASNLDWQLVSHMIFYMFI